MAGGYITKSTLDTIRGHQRFTRIHPCEIDKDLLVRLFDKLQVIQSKALKLELARADKMLENPPKRFKEEDCEQLKKDIADNYEVHVEIWGKREFVAGTSSSVFNEIPIDVVRIRFDNSSTFKRRFNRDPISVFAVNLDILEPPMFDFNASPSQSTRNNSFIQVSSDDITWVEGTSGIIQNLLKERKTKRTWIHKPNIYDMIMLLLILPFTFWNLYKLDLLLHEYFSHTSSAFMVFFYLFAFLLILIVFRCLFSYFKWLFPYIELNLSDRQRSRRYRKFQISIYLVIILALIRDAFIVLIKLLF